MRTGQYITAAAGEIGTLAFVGRKQILVYRKPVVAILSTGNEISDLHAESAGSDSPEAWGRIWDTNRPALRAALEGLGFEVEDLGIAKDVVSAHVQCLRDGLERADVIVTTGGTSMAATDLLKPVIERNLGGTIHFGRVMVKPGKPTTFATVPVENGPPKMIFALPGNPASALVCFYLFVVPALRRLGGLSLERCTLPRVQVELGDSMRLDARPEYHRVHIRRGATGLIAFSTGGQRSSRMTSMCGANGLVALPPLVRGGKTTMEAGELAEAVVIGEIEA